MSHRLLPKDEARLIVMFQDPDYIDNRQFTSIHKIVVGLLDRPLALEIKDRIVDIDAVDAHGKTAVAWVAARKERATLQTLLEAGANPDIIDNERYTAIFHAAEAPDPGCVSLLLEHRSNPNHMDALGATAFHRACEADNDPCLLEPFITGGININLHQGRSGDTGVAGASREGRLSNVCYLLDKKANPNVVNAAGETAIFMAIHHNRPKILERLLHTGASPNICNRKGQSILHSAARLGKPDVLMILQDIDYGDIDPELEDDNKMKAVDYFAERQKIVNVDPEVQRAFRELMKIANAKYRSE